MAQYEFSSEHLPDNFDELVKVVHGTALVVSDYTDYYPEDFLETSRFASLSARDKVRVVKSISVHSDDIDRQWGLDQKVFDDGLFPYRVSTVFERISAVDAYVISGACGSDVLYDAEESGMKLEQLDQNLDALRILGALAANSFNGFDGWENITINGDTELMIGADLNGDFRMTHRKIRDKVSMTPHGDVVPFAPVNYEMISAYHSVEEDIVDSLLEHMASAMSDVEKTRLYNKIIEGSDWGEGTKGVNPFGDYGVGGWISFSREWNDIASNRNGSIICEVRVSPSPRSQLQLAIASETEGIRIMQRQYADDEVTFKVLSEVYIPDNDIVTVIRAIGLSDRGRTSPLEIKQLLEMKLLGKRNDSIN